VKYSLLLITCQYELAKPLIIDNLFYIAYYPNMLNTLYEIRAETSTMIQLRAAIVRRPWAEAMEEITQVPHTVTKG